MTMHSNRSRRDVGMTLTEVVVVVAILGLITTVVVGAVTVVFRSERGVTTTVAESHDVQQAVNYFHLDVQSGPIDPSAYRTTPGSRGSGCADSGDDNILRYDTEDGGRVAYRLTSAGGVGRIDRFECAVDGAVVEVVNIADSLDASSPAPVTVSLVTGPNPSGTGGDVVERVEMSFAQSNGYEQVSAAPRAETGLDAGAAPATCDPDPMAAALGFGAFVGGDVYLESGLLEGSLAVGGDLGWVGLREIAQHDTNNALTGYKSVAVYANGVDWNYAAGNNILRATNGSKALVLGTGYNVVQSGNNPRRVYESGRTSGNHFEFPKNATVGSTSVAPIDFAAQMALLQACSAAMANLPSSCDDCAQFVTPLNENGNGPYPGSGKLTVEFDDNKTQVLNIPESKLGAIPEVKRKNGSSLNNKRPLVVNVYEDENDPGATFDGNIDFDFRSSDWQNVGDSKFVLYNFPNATGTVTIEQDIYGVVFAPFATVVTKGQVHAAVVAANWTHRGGTVQNDQSKIFNGSIGWDD